MTQPASLHLPRSAPRILHKFHDQDGEWEHVGDRVEWVWFVVSTIALALMCWGGWAFLGWVRHALS
jgi:hypothetical protein